MADFPLHLVRPYAGFPDVRRARAAFDELDGQEQDAFVIAMNGDSAERAAAVKGLLGQDDTTGAQGSAPAGELASHPGQPAGGEPAPDVELSNSDQPVPIPGAPEWDGAAPVPGSAEDGDSEPEPVTDPDPATDPAPGGQQDDGETPAGGGPADPEPTDEELTTVLHGNVGEVIAWAQAHPGSAARLAELERDDKGRVTLLDDLDRIAGQ